MSIKYDGNKGKLFQTNKMITELEKDRKKQAQLYKTVSAEILQLDASTVASINVFNPIYEITGESK